MLARQTPRREPAGSDRLPSYRSESPTGYSSTGSSPAEPASASPSLTMVADPARASNALAQPHCKDNALPWFAFGATQGVISTWRAGCDFYLAPTVFQRLLPERPSDASRRTISSRPGLRAYPSGSCGSPEDGNAKIRAGRTRSMSGNPADGRDLRLRTRCRPRRKSRHPRLDSRRGRRQCENSRLRLVVPLQRRHFFEPSPKMHLAVAYFYNQAARISGSTGIQTPECRNIISAVSGGFVNIDVKARLAYAIII